MIARIWHGKVPTAKAQAYHQYLLSTGLRDYAAVKGNQGVSLLKKEEGDTTHFYTLTYWDDIDADRPCGMVCRFSLLQVQNKQQPGTYKHCLANDHCRYCIYPCRYAKHDIPSPILSTDTALPYSPFGWGIQIFLKMASLFLKMHMVKESMELVYQRSTGEALTPNRPSLSRQ